MFALKYLLKNVKRMDITRAYVETVITKEFGKSTMLLACQVAYDLYSQVILLITLIVKILKLTSVFIGK